MAVKPIKILQIRQTVLTATDYWPESEEGDIFAGYPYRWEVNLNVTALLHGSPSTPTPYQYDGLDVKVGDWVSTSAGGSAVKIVSIISATGSLVHAVVEDVDRFNTFSDQSFSGQGIGPDGSGYLFEIDEQGLPILGPSAAYYTDITFQTDLLARFGYRNSIKRYVDVVQAGHTFAIGDIIYMDSTGVYQKLAADKDHKDTIQRIVGVVTSIGIPGVAHFTFKPRGDYQTNITPALPAEALPGQFIYIDPANPGKLTATTPTQYAVPVYIRLGDASTGILLSGGAGGSSTGPLGYNASSYVVANLTERDALDKDTLNVGDFAYVVDDGTGKWAFYEITAKVDSPAAVTWTIIQSQALLETDPSRIFSTDGKTFVDTQKAGSLNKIVAGSNEKTVLEIEGSTTNAIKGEKLTLTHTDDEVQLVAKNTDGTGKVDVRVLPQGQGHVFFGSLGDGIVESEKTFDLTVRGGAGDGVSAPGQLDLTGGNSPSGNFNGGDVFVKPGLGSGTGSAGKVQILDQFDTPVLGFKSAGETSSNFIDIANGANNSDPAINGVKISASADSSSANVDLYLDPKGSGLVRVSDFSTYSAALQQTGGNDALVTKAFVLSLAGLGEGQVSTIIAGTGLTDDNGVFNVNVGANTIGVDGVNNLIVKGSSNAGEILISTGVAGDQAVYGKLDLSSNASFTGVLAPTNGGLGFTSFAGGDILVGNAGGTLSKVSIGDTGKALFSTGTSLEYAFVNKLVDANGADVIVTSASTNPVNHFYSKNAAADSILEFGAEGTDTNVSIRLATKGTGLLLAPVGYTANIGSDPDTIVTKKYIDDAIAAGGDSLTRQITLSSGWASSMAIGAALPNVIGKSVYVERAIVRVISPITGGGATNLKIMSEANVIADAYESDILVAGTYIVDLPEAFTSSNVQLTAMFYADDISTPATPVDGSIQITITYKIR
jgi:hypothetical protein